MTQVCLNILPRTTLQEELRYKKMVNLTESENQTAIQYLSCSARLFGSQQKIIFSAFNIPLSITAFLGNVLIIIALQKPSSLHPSSKLLFGCLTITDLGVGLITQPLRVVYLMSTEQSKLCYYVLILYNTMGLIFCGVSILTLTAISVDRLLALMLGLRYKQVVTLRRAWILVIIFCFWLLTIAIVITVFYNPSIRNFVLCAITFLFLIISTFCYAKIYFALRKHQARLHQRQPRGCFQGQSENGGTPLNIARYRKTVTSALWVQITLVFCYLPYGVVTTIYAITGDFSPFMDLAWEITVVLVLLNSSLNPFIYCWKIKGIRQVVKDITSRFCCCLR